MCEVPLGFHDEILLRQREVLNRKYLRHLETASVPGKCRQRRSVVRVVNANSAFSALHFQNFRDIFMAIHQTTYELRQFRATDGTEKLVVVAEDASHRNFALLDRCYT